LSYAEVLRFALQALGGHRLRTGLSLVGVAIGVAAVVMLTALGEGARVYVVDQFASLGTNLLVVLPGRTETTGSFGIGGVPNDLTLDDTLAVSRNIAEASLVAPMAMGTVEVSHRERSRQVAVIGTTHEYQELRELTLARGEFLPPDELFRGGSVAVLGHLIARELFPHADPLGEIVRVGDWRMRVIGVMAPQGTKFGFDFDDLVIVPASTSMRMLNRSSLFRILVQVNTHADLDVARDRVRDLLTERHREEDITVVTQDALVSTFSGILATLTLVVGAIGAISLTVAGIGIMNVMLVSVSERTREIGLLKAVGVGRRQILTVFLTEAALLSTAGGLVGLAIGWGAVRLAVGLFPTLPASPPQWAVITAFAVSVAVGIVFGLLPARQATRLDPVRALSQR
jgi:putative ABC transport system permease protein